MVDVSNSPAQNPGNTPILTVTWDTVIGQVPAEDRDYEDGPAYEPVSLRDAVVDAIAHRLAEEIRGEVRKATLAAVQPAISAEVGAIVREQLNGSVRKTNRWGEAEGEPQTLRSMLGDEVQAYLNEKPRENRNGYSDHGPRAGGFRELLKREVDDALTKDLRNVIVEARKQVVGKVQSKAAALIAEAVK